MQFNLLLIDHLISLVYDEVYEELDVSEQERDIEVERRLDLMAEWLYEKHKEEQR